MTVCTAATSLAAAARSVLVEAEAFHDPGGWVIDTQSMDVMGSPYLLAHGLGKPVVKASTKARFAAAGAYRVWVHTRDWVPPHGPGKFRLHVGGRPVAKVFGAEGDGTWQWHDGGAVEVQAGETLLELEDLTGFDGRCDAILFVAEAPPDFRPPNSGKEMADFRRRLLGLPETPADGGTYDFVVVGGGYAGTCAAIAAARLGLTVALIQDRPVLGGNASSEVRVGPIGGLDKGPFLHNADIVKEIHRGAGGVQSSGGLRARPNDGHLLAMVQAEKNISLFLETHAFAVEKDGLRLKAVVARHVRTSEEKVFRGALFADCTGDATVGFLAGADWRMGREGRPETGELLAPPQADKLLMGMSNFWTAVHTGAPAAFPACPWALPITEESVEVSTPKYPPKFGEYAYVGGWNWEGGFNRDPIAEAERVRDHNLRAIFGTWDFLKNRSKDRQEYADAELEWAAFISGKRESRRLLGDLILTQQDMTEPKVYPDACVTATWYFDIHYPHPDNTRFFPGEEFRSLAYDDPNFERLRGSIPGTYTTIKPYPIPYRCFYSRNVPNLFMAGRDISVTHVGLAPVRVMNTTGMMGTVVGRAAWLCRKLSVDPRAVYEKHLEEFKALLTNPQKQ
jgi:hypothetical protein